MQEKVLKTLEFNKIIAHLQQHASSSPGKSLSDHFIPNADLEEEIGLSMN